MADIILPATSAAPIPGDQFHLSLEVRGGGTCGGRIPPALSALAKSGIDTSLTLLLTQATIFYKNRSVKRRSGETKSDARIRRQWQDLEDFEPRVVTGPDKVRRLVITKPVNGEDSKPVSKMLGEAVGLHVAQLVTGIQYRLWTPRAYEKNVRHDLEAPGPDGLALAEVRGRFDGNNLNAAVKDIEKKFAAHFAGKGPPMRTQAVGVVYSLRDSPDNGCVGFAHDVVVADPEEDGEPPDELARWRSLLVHYILSLRRQGLHTAADRLVHPLSMDDKALLKAVRGRQQIAPIVTAGRAPTSGWGRTTVRVPGFEGTVGEYVGTFFRDLWTREGSGNGPGLFFGINVGVVNALARCRLDDLDAMRAPTWLGSVGRFNYVRSDDGSLYIRSARQGISILDHP